MKKMLQIDKLEENKAGDFVNLYVKDILTSKDNDKISFYYCRMEAGGNISEDKHECMEVYYFLKGTGKAVVGNDTFEVSPGNVICVDSNEVHSVINTSDMDLEFLAILSPPYT